MSRQRWLVLAVLIVIAMTTAAVLHPPAFALNDLPTFSAIHLTADPSSAPDPSEPSPPGGLGNTRENLESIHGTPEGLQGTMIAYGDRNYAVGYHGGRAASILIILPDGGLASLNEARSRVHAFMPDDAVLIGTLQASPNRIADVYHSRNLATMAAAAYSSEVESRSGEFVIVYETNPDGRIDRALLAVGGVPKH